MAETAVWMDDSRQVWTLRLNWVGVFCCAGHSGGCKGEICVYFPLACSRHRDAKQKYNLQSYQFQNILDCRGADYTQRGLNAEPSLDSPGAAALNASLHLNQYLRHNGKDRTSMCGFAFAIIHDGNMWILILISVFNEAGLVFVSTFCKSPTF